MPKQFTAEQLAASAAVGEFWGPPTTEERVSQL